jgi:hypothetical protein
LLAEVAEVEMEAAEEEQEDYFTTVHLLYLLQHNTLYRLAEVDQEPQHVLQEVVELIHFLAIR